MSGAARFMGSVRVTSLLTLVSRVAGLVREIVFSYFFSTGELLSAFRIAFVIPNLARRLFGEGALSAAVIPVLTTTLRDRGEESSRGFVGSLLTGLAMILGAGVVLAELVVFVWRQVQDDPAVRLTAITLPYMPIICVVALLSGVLNVRGQFAAPAAAPILFNAVVIAATLGAAFAAGLEGAALMDVLCWSVLLGGLAQLGLVWWALWRERFLPTRGLGLRDPQLRTVAGMMAPMFIGLSAVQINTLFDSVIAYLFIVVNGERVGPAVLGYAQFLYQFPLGVFGIGLATAIFPLLSAKAAAQDRVGLADAVQRGLRLSMFIALPAAVGMMFVARPLVAVLYERGAFTAESTRRVADTLVCYCVGMAAYFAQHVVIRTFYALHDSKTPARVALWMVLTNLVMNFALVVPLQERGLALATAICATVQVIWLARSLGRLLPELDWRPVVRGVRKTAIACVMMGAALAPMLRPPASGLWFLSRDAVQLIELVAVGCLIYAIAGRLLRIEEMSWILKGRSGPTDAADFDPM